MASLFLSTSRPELGRHLRANRIPQSKGQVHSHKKSFGLLSQVFSSDSVHDLTVRSKQASRDIGVASIENQSTAQSRHKAGKREKVDYTGIARYDLGSFENIYRWNIPDLRDKLASISGICDALESNPEKKIVLENGKIGTNIDFLKDSFAKIVRAPPGVYPSIADQLQLYRNLSDQLYRLWPLVARDEWTTCVVCRDMKEKKSFPKHVTQNCDHKIKSCRDCLKTWVRTQLESQGWNHIKCPECANLLTKEDMREAASKEIYSRYLPGATIEIRLIIYRYKSLRHRAKLSSDPDYHFCLSSKCDAGQIHPPSAGPKFKCTTCGYKACLNHKGKWHSRETCEQHDDRVSGAKKRREANNASEKWKAGQAKLCTNCEAPIQKIGGCNDVWCK